MWSLSVVLETVATVAETTVVVATTAARVDAVTESAASTLTAAKVDAAMTIADPAVPQVPAPKHLLPQQMISVNPLKKFSSKN